ncbi:MAG: alpha-amylase family glycosyl hydrolase [Candidatus Hodarchaeales archaeon]
MKSKTFWWKKAVFYQIYPRSFLDTSGNGIGDLPGITSKLPYLKELGIDAIWLSPFFPSPDHDFGYDIADYTAINPIFGSMDDFDELLDTAHDLDLKIVLDLVLNHTSIEHPWFKESRSSKNNPKRDWYIWRDGRGKGNKYPNNWKSEFTGPAWTYDERTGQYYYHHFLPEQPDLNYRNPAVKEAIFEEIRFWLDKGVDGFRLDVIHCIFEDPSLKNNPWSWQLLPSDNNNAALFQDHVYDKNLPENYEFVKELRELLDKYTPDRMMVGEVLAPPETIKNFYGSVKNGTNDGLHLCFNFLFTSSPFNPREFRKRIERIESTLPDPYWPCYAFSNHDRSRAISRHGNSVKKAKILTALLLTIRCTPFLYYGEEIGMTDGKIPRKRLQDPVGKKFWYIPLKLGRDICRTPMQWDSGKFAGFSSSNDTWLPVNDNYRNINLARQINDPRSLFTFYKELLALRKTSPALMEGDLHFIEISSNKRCLAYVRSSRSDKALILLNFSPREQVVDFYSPILEHETWYKVFPGELCRLRPEKWVIHGYGVVIWQNEENF